MALPNPQAPPNHPTGPLPSPAAWSSPQHSRYPDPSCEYDPPPTPSRTLSDLSLPRALGQEQEHHPFGTRAELDAQPPPPHHGNARPRPHLDFSTSHSFQREHEHHPFGTRSELAALDALPTTSATTSAEEGDIELTALPSARTIHVNPHDTTDRYHFSEVPILPRPFPAHRSSTLNATQAAPHETWYQPPPLSTTDWLREREQGGCPAPTSPPPAYLRKTDGLPPPNTAPTPKASFSARIQAARLPRITFPYTPAFRMPVFRRREPIHGYNTRVLRNDTRVPRRGKFRSACRTVFILMVALIATLFFVVTIYGSSKEFEASS